ncbi:MAG: serine/threonine-protein kinase [Candidatus Eiseniibacteriota bacterium]
MPADRDPVEDLLAAVSDGHPVDWAAASRDFELDGRMRLDALQEVSRIADFNRRLQEEATGGPMPERWGELLLLERIGTGANAEVLRAWDPALHREVALKLLPAGVEDTQLLEEGRAAARIRHPHVAAVHGIDRRNGRLGMWMELVRGRNLEQEVRARGPLTPGETTRLGREIASALVAVHAAGLLHRDVKPANIVHDAEGRYVLTDFGLGVSQDDAARGAAGSAGTPMYMAPELLTGASPSEPSDVYGLGLVLWFALAGRHPFPAEALPHLAKAAAVGPKPALREIRTDVPHGLLEIVERAIASDPALRTSQARAVSNALDGLAVPGDGRTVSDRPRRVSPVVLVSLVAAAAAAAAITTTLLRTRKPATVPVVAPAGPASPSSPSSPAPVTTYAVQASFLRHDARGEARLVSGDRVKPGDRLSLEFHATRAAWVYVLDEDERGERYLLFPQPLFDTPNPLAADSVYRLPGAIGGRDQGWTVTSRGGREYLLVVASPEPVSELEAELHRLPAPRPGRPIEYATVGETSVERLRGIGGVSPVPSGPSRPAGPTPAFARFRALAGREGEVSGVWVRQISLENPTR